MIPAAIAVVALVALVVALLVLHERERREWVKERRALVDRAIATHTGEIIALDRNERKRPDREREPRPEPVGL